MKVKEFNKNKSLSKIRKSTKNLSKLYNINKLNLELNVDKVKLNNDIITRSNLSINNTKKLGIKTNINKYSTIKDKSSNTFKNIIAIDLTV